MKKRYNAVVAWLSKEGKYSGEIKLIFLVVSLYGVFITWGYLQEKLTSTRYQNIDNEIVKWEYPLILSLFVNLSAAIAAYLAPQFIFNEGETPESPGKMKKRKPEAPFYVFWKPALSANVATSLSYISLQYISYPLMILSKSCKHVPVMFVGKVFYSKKYHWSKYVSVLLICMGITLFTAMKSSVKASTNVSNLQKSADTRDTNDFALSITLFIGLFFVFVHLVLDGVTSNEQDHLFSSYSISSFQMMQNINLWQAIYSCSYLLCEFVYNYFFVTKMDITQTRIFGALNFLSKTPDACFDIVIFCFCACIGQLLIFMLIREFGSLLWITISVTRQLFTILLSVFLFNHSLGSFQWVGIGLVFSGMGFEIFMNYYLKNKAAAAVVATNAVSSGTSSGNSSANPTPNPTPRVPVSSMPLRTKSPRPEISPRPSTPIPLLSSRPGSPRPLTSPRPPSPRLISPRIPPRTCSPGLQSHPYQHHFLPEQRLTLDNLKKTN
jgi:UDP-galactose transporter B1